MSAYGQAIEMQPPPAGVDPGLETGAPEMIAERPLVGTDGHRVGHPSNLDFGARSSTTSHDPCVTSEPIRTSQSRK